MSLHTFCIVQTAKGFLVRPPFVLASPDDDVRFVNLTPLRAQVMVPDGSFLGASGTILAIDPGFAPPPARVSGHGGPGSYPFQVYLEETGDAPLRRRLFATGESAPHVIIE